MLGFNQTSVGLKAGLVSGVLAGVVTCFNQTSVGLKAIACTTSGRRPSCFNQTSVGLKGITGLNAVTFPAVFQSDQRGIEREVRRAGKCGSNHGASCGVVCYLSRGILDRPISTTGLMEAR